MYAALPMMRGRPSIIGRRGFPPRAPLALNGMNPMASSCVFLAVYNQASLQGRDIRNLARHRAHATSVAALSGSNIVPAQFRGQWGLRFSGDGTADRLTYGSIATTDRASLNHTNAATIMWGGVNFTTGSTPSSFPHVICQGQNGDQQWRVYHDRSNNSVNLNISAASVETGINSFIEGTSQDRPYVFAFLRKADAVEGWYAMMDAASRSSLVLAGTGTGLGTGTFDHTAGDELVVGNWAGGSTDRNWEGDLFWVAVFDRALSYSEMNYVMLQGGIYDLAMPRQSLWLPGVMVATSPGGDATLTRPRTMGGFGRMMG